MSPIENDLWESFLTLAPPAVFLIAWVVCPVFFWPHDLFKGYVKGDRSYRPLGLTFFRYSRVWLGDTILAIVLTLSVVFYDRVTVASSFLTTLGYSVLTTLIGIALALGFVAFEEVGGVYPKGKKLTIGRVWHTVYFAIMAGLLIAAAVRLFVYGIIDGEERGLALLAFVLFFIGYGVTVWLDETDRNLLWNRIHRWKPQLTELP